MEINYVKAILSEYYTYEVGLFRVKKIKFYDSNPDRYGIFIVFNRLKPMAYLTLSSELHGYSLDIVYQLCSEKNIIFGDFVNRIIKKASNNILSLRPRSESKYRILSPFHYEETDGVREFLLPYYNLDIDWEKLSQKDIDRLIKKAKKA